MKSWLVFLLALVLVGSLVPCCPADNCADEATHSPAQDDQQDHSTGACSPFFTCGSCTGFVQLAVQYGIVVPATERPAHFEKLAAFFASAYYASFFQPPRSSGFYTV